MVQPTQLTEVSSPVLMASSAVATMVPSTAIIISARAMMQNTSKRRTGCSCVSAWRSDARLSEGSVMSAFWRRCVRHELDKGSARASEIADAWRWQEYGSTRDSRSISRDAGALQFCIAAALAQTQPLEYARITIHWRQDSKTCKPISGSSAGGKGALAFTKR